MRQVWNRLFGGECEHPRTLVIESVGVRRTVCETCGHLSFEMVDGVSARQHHHPQTQAELPKAVGL